MTTATAAIANHLNIAESIISSVEEWAHVLFVRFIGRRPRFVSKKVVEMEFQLPELKGSEKQVAWAEQVRQSLLDGVSHLEKVADWSINGRFDESGKMTLRPVDEEDHDEIKSELAFTKQWLETNVLNQSDATFWINNRNKNWLNAAGKAFDA